MENNEFSQYITLKKINSKDVLKIDQKYLKLKVSSKGIMAFHYKAPIEKTIELEIFFDDYNPIENLSLDIADTGDLEVSFRGIIDGKDDNLPIDYDYKILMLEERKCRKVDVKYIKRSSKFKPRYTVED